MSGLIWVSVFRLAYVISKYVNDIDRLGTAGTTKSVPIVQLRAVSGRRLGLVPYRPSAGVMPVGELESFNLPMTLWLPDTTRSVKVGGLNDFVQLLRTFQSRLI